MIQAEDKLKLNSAAVEVFGTMYYTPIELLPEVPEKSAWQLDSSYVRASIQYSGPQEAKLDFYFPCSLAKNIAEGFLGVDPADLTEAQVVDTMREAANMIGGNFLGKIDPEGACVLGIPEAGLVENFLPDEMGQGRHLLAFISDFGHLWLFLG